MSSAIEVPSGIEANVDDVGDLSHARYETGEVQYRMPESDEGRTAAEGVDVGDGVAVREGASVQGDEILVPYSG